MLLLQQPSLLLLPALLLLAAPVQAFFLPPCSSSASVQRSGLSALMEGVRQQSTHTDDQPNRRVSPLVPSQSMIGLSSRSGIDSAIRQRPRPARHASAWASATPAEGKARSLLTGEVPFQLYNTASRKKEPFKTGALVGN